MRLSREAVRAWLVSRAAVLALMALTAWLQARHGYGRAPVQDGATGFFAWDGWWYREIATEGYARDEALRFFPLYPFVSLHPVGLVLVANLSALAYAEGLTRLTAFELGPRAAGRVPWLALVNPAAFVLVIAYAEAPAAALCVWALYAARRGQWTAAAPLAFGAGLTRPIGLLVALPLAMEALRALSPRRVLAAAAAPLGTATFLLWCQVTRGDALLPFRVQQRPELRSGVWEPPFDELGRAWTALTDLGPWNLALRPFWIVGLLALLAVTARRLPASYTAYAGVLLLLALGTPRLASFERYAFAAFPLLVAAASLRSRLASVTTGAAFAAGLALYSILGFSNRYVP